MSSLRLVFAGSPAAAIPSLNALADSDHELVAVLTREDSPQGRRRVLTPTPVATAAVEHNIRVIKANRLTDDVAEQVSALDADLGVIVAYGALVREPLLSTPRLGWINLHFSVLPSWRGAAPVQRAIMAGDGVTGASVFQLVEELDAGPVFGRLTQSIGRNETAGHLLESLAQSGAGLLRNVVDAIATSQARADQQEGDVSLAPKLTLEDGRIRWDASSTRVHNQIRGVTPEPGAFTTLGGDRLKILDAVISRDRASRTPGNFELDGAAVLVGTSSHPIELITVQPAGKKPMSAADWWRGRPATAATVADQ